VTDRLPLTYVDGKHKQLQPGDDLLLEEGLTVQAAIDAAVATATGGQVLQGLATGGVVAWQSDYIYRISAATYYIEGVLYSSAEQTVTLDAADGANDRIDALALDTTGDFVKITGTAAAQPSSPAVDPGTQLQLALVLVTAATTEPVLASDEDIYVNNAEWTSSTSGSGFNANSTNNPNSATKCIEGTAVAANAYVQLQDGGSHTSDDYETLVFFIRSKANWNNSRGLRFQFYASGVAKGAAVNVARNTWGFDASQTATYQFIAIPLSQFALPVGTSFNQLRITDYGGSIGFYIDDIKLKTTGSSGTPSGTSGISQEQADARYLQLTGGTLTGDLRVPDEAYDATAWNNNLETPTKNAVRDKIEAIVAGVPSLDALAWKQPVRAASTANGTLATAFENGDTLDGVTLATGDRILLKDQSSGAENGIYTVNASGAPSRASDADTGAEMLGATVSVMEGTANADKTFACTTNSTITIGSTSLTFAQASGGAGGLLAANNLSDVASAVTSRANLGLNTRTVEFSIIGTALTASEVLGHVMPPSGETWTFPANLTTSAGVKVTGGTNPASTYAITLKKNGSTVATISISTSGVVTFATSGGTSFSLTGGTDEMQIIGAATPDTAVGYVIALGCTWA